MAELVFQQGTARAWRLRLGEVAITVGRSRDADVMLLDRRVSRIHCRIEPSSSGWRVVDLSGRGLQLDGHAVSDAGDDLSEGSRLELGPYQITYVDGAGPVSEVTTLVSPTHRPPLLLPEPPPVGPLLSRVEEEDDTISITPPRRVEQLPGLIGDAPATRELVARIRRLAPHRIPVFVQGETGSGKEVAAQALHAASRRSREPWVALNCAALGSGTSLSELFGHERGAFTGADRTHVGVFEQAHGGTLLLDEVAELSLEQQAALLRVLERGEVRRVGGQQDRPVDVRIITATHRNLEQRVAAGLFREDLLFRLCVGRVDVPPLRDRVDDIVPLAFHLFQGSGVSGLTARAAARLRRHAWPGNVRELRNVLLLAQVESNGDVLKSGHLALDAGAALLRGNPVIRPASVGRPHDDRLTEAAQRWGADWKRACAELGIARATYFRRLAALGWRPSELRSADAPSPPSSDLRERVDPPIGQVDDAVLFEATSGQLVP